MADREIFNTRIECLAAGGAGLARPGGKSVFIEGALPGELVCCRVTGERRDWSEAELLEVIEASPDRAEPACVFYGACGGCNLQHLSYQAQLAAKAAVFTELFRRSGCAIPPPPVFPSPPFEYRNRVQFHRGGQPQKKMNGCAFGLKARKSNEIAAVSDCPIADPLIRDVLRKAADGGSPLNLPPEKDRFTVYARNGLLLSEGGVSRGKMRILNREILMDAGVFFQSNGVMLEALITDILEIAAAANRSLPMADIYCGVGTFAAFLGEWFPRVDLVEENKNALALARENVKNSRAEFFALRDDSWATMKRRDCAANSAYGFAVADPPRKGLSPSLSRWLAENGPPLLAYVSCDPATLARDSKILAGGGYCLAESRIYDFYPQTAHIESLTVFKRA